MSEETTTAARTIDVFKLVERLAREGELGEATRIPERHTLDPLKLAQTAILLRIADSLDIIMNTLGEDPGLDGPTIHDTLKRLLRED